MLRLGRESGRILERIIKELGGLIRFVVFFVLVEDRLEASVVVLNLITSSIGSINMFVDIDGIIYIGEVFGVLREVVGVGVFLLLFYLKIFLGVVFFFVVFRF